MPEETDYGKIIVLTGAGASAAFRVPTMAQFLPLVQDAGAPLADMAGGMNGGHGSSDVEEMYRTLELYVEAARTKDSGDRNLEEAFGCGSGAHALLARAEESLSQLQSLMLEHWGKVTRATKEELQLCLETLSRLRCLSGRPLRLFTTNYDLTPESLGLSIKKGTLVNGFEWSGLERYHWSEVIYRRDVRPETILVAYRLHGCSHWLWDTSRGGITYYPDLPEEHDGLRPMVIFPERDKADRVFAEAPFRFAYWALREAMASASVCAVIGCSFRDGSLVDALQLWSNEGGRDSMRFVVVDPTECSEGIFEKLRGWRVRHIRGKFGHPKVNDCLVSTCEHLLQDDAQYREETRVPGTECWQCLDYKACSVAVRQSPQEEMRTYALPPPPEY